MSLIRGLVLSLAAILWVSTFGQTAVDISHKYPAVNAYAVRPDILMTARYAEDGQVCQMVLEKRHKTPEKTDFSSTIPHDQVRQLIDELVPRVERGRPARHYLRGESESTISGNIEITDSDYENVSIQILGSLSQAESGAIVITIAWKRRRCLDSKAEQIIPDEITAVKVAEAVLPPIFGPEEVEKYSPYHAQLRDGIWTVYGTLKPGSRGGTPQITIQKKDGKVLEVWHSQ